jgi:uncharacterized membrane protein YidH (DUF202 family)
MQQRQLGILLILLGIAAAAYGLVGYNRETAVINVGGYKATATEHVTTPLATVLGVAGIAGGVVLLLGSKPRA